MIKTEDIIKKTTLTEREVNLLKRRLNDGKVCQEDIFDGFTKSFNIDEAHTLKGINWLKNQWKTPRGIERKNNPFGYREQDVVENFSHFELASFLDHVNYTQSEMGIKNHIPIWDVFSKNGGSFQYYNDFKGVTIIG